MLSVARVYMGHISPLLPQPPVPVITTGINLFLILAYLFSHINPSLLEAWALSPNQLINKEFPRLNTYPLVHSNFLHLFFNLLVLYTPLADFEIHHGSLHTAIVVNTLGAVTGIAYTITTYILVKLNLEAPQALATMILGSSGFAFAFLTVSCCKKSQSQPNIQLFAYTIPTLFIPLVYLVTSALIMPNSSFLGHLISIIIGLLIFHGIFALITIPPFKILQKIESIPLFSYAIDSIFPQEYFVWTWEHSVVDSRYKGDTIQLPLHEEGQRVGTGSS